MNTLDKYFQTKPIMEIEKPYVQETQSRIPLIPSGTTPKAKAFDPSIDMDIDPPRGELLQAIGSPFKGEVLDVEVLSLKDDMGVSVRMVKYNQEAFVPLYAVDRRVRYRPGFIYSAKVINHDPRINTLGGPYTDLSFVV